MTLRLPTPSAAYNPQEMNEAFRSIEAILRQLVQSTDALPDPAKSLNNFRAVAETDTTITYAWSAGDNVIGVWLYELDAVAPLASDPWATLPPTPRVRLARDVAQATVNKPKQGFYHIAKFEPRLAGSLAVGRPVKLTIVPAQAAFGAAIHAAVTNDVADLTVDWKAGQGDLPARFRVYEGDPVDPPIVDVTVVAGTSGSFDKTTQSALGARPLPLRALSRWWVRSTNTAGIEVWNGPAAADRDSLPNGAVTATGSALRCEYDDDTDVIRLTTPLGKTKTWSSLFGGGTVTYSVGDVLDDGTMEAPLAADEVRDGYRVDYTGGGVTLSLYNGPLRGPNKDFTPPSLDVSVTELGDRYTIAYTAAAGASVSYRVDSGSWAAAPSSPFDVFRTAADRVVQLKAVGANGIEGDPRTITIPALAGSAGGGGSFSTLTNVLHDAATNTIDFGWAWSGDAATFRVWIRDPVRYGDTVYHFFATTSSGATLYTYTTTADLTTNHADPTDDFGFYVEAVVGSTIDARSVETVATYNHI